LFNVLEVDHEIIGSENDSIFFTEVDSSELRLSWLTLYSAQEWLPTSAISNREYVTLLSLPPSSNFVPGNPRETLKALIHRKTYSKDGPVIVEFNQDKQRSLIITCPVEGYIRSLKFPLSVAKGSPSENQFGISEVWEDFQDLDGLSHLWDDSRAQQPILWLGEIIGQQALILESRCNGLLKL
jgi:hypothetical protein